MPQILKKFFGPAQPPNTEHLLDVASCQAEHPTDAADTGDAEIARELGRAEASANEAESIRLRQIVEDADCKLQELRDAWRRRWEQEAVRLACKIASRCLRDLPFDSAELASKLMDESLRGVRLQGGCEVRLNPEDFRMLTNCDRMPTRDVVVMPDSSIEPGGCLVKTPDGCVDQTLESQLRRIEQELTDI